MRPPSKAAQKLNHSGKCKCINTRTWRKKLYFECGSSSYSRVCFLQLCDSIWVRISRKCTYNLCTSIYVQQEYSLGIIIVGIISINFIIIDIIFIFSNIIINKILMIKITSIILVIIIISSLNAILMILIQGQVRSEMQSDCAMRTNTLPLSIVKDKFYFHDCQKQVKIKAQKQIYLRIKRLTNSFTMTMLGLHFQLS